MINPLECPECGHDGRHQKQLNPDNSGDWICGACSHAWKTKRSDDNPERKLDEFDSWLA